MDDEDGGNDGDLWVANFNLSFKWQFLPLRYDRDEETESETKVRMPEDEYDNMESAGNVSQL